MSFSIESASKALQSAFVNLTGIQMNDEAKLSDDALAALSEIQANATDFVDFQVPKIFAINAEFETQNSNVVYAGPRLMESLYQSFSQADSGLFHTTQMSPVTIPLLGDNTPETQVATGDNALGTFYKIVPKVNTESNICDITITDELENVYRLRPINYDQDVYIFVPRIEVIYVGNFAVVPTVGKLTFNLGNEKDSSHFVWAVGPIGQNNKIACVNAQVWTRPLFIKEQGTALVAAMIAFGMGEAMLDSNDFALYSTTLITGMLVAAFNNPDSYNKA